MFWGTRLTRLIQQDITVKDLAMLTHIINVC